MRCYLGRIRVYVDFRKRNMNDRNAHGYTHASKRTKIMKFRFKNKNLITTAKTSSSA